MKLTDKGGKQISPIFIFLIIIAVVLLIFWAGKIRAKKAEDRSPELSASTKCRVCGQDNPPEAGFCAKCGATLVAEVEAPAEATAVAVEYVSSMIRLGAAAIDAVAAIIVSVLFSFLAFRFMAFGGMFLFLVLLLLYHWLFTGLRGQTPGKMALGIKVVDAQGNRPTLRVAALREVLGKLISTVVLCLGFFWIDSDKQKRGWHDTIAGTYVVKVVKAKSKE